MEVASGNWIQQAVAYRRYKVRNFRDKSQAFLEFGEKNQANSSKTILALPYFSLEANFTCLRYGLLKTMGELDGMFRQNLTGRYCVKIYFRKVGIDRRKHYRRAVRKTI